ncbi:MAG: hypothetical protein M3O94_01850, partial [Actinomycetota bacterium]|nr:hypothetical protein [Actinomycetota bacterium]
MIEIGLAGVVDGDPAGADGLDVSRAGVVVEDDPDCGVVTWVGRWAPVPPLQAARTTTAVASTAGTVVRRRRVICSPYRMRAATSTDDGATGESQHAIP